MLKYEETCFAKKMISDCPIPSSEYIKDTFCTLYKAGEEFKNKFWNQEIKLTFFDGRVININLKPSEFISTIGIDLKRIRKAQNDTRVLDMLEEMNDNPQMYEDFNSRNGGYIFNYYKIKVKSTLFIETPEFSSLKYFLLTDPLTKKDYLVFSSMEKELSFISYLLSKKEKNYSIEDTLIYKEKFPSAFNGLNLTFPVSCKISDNKNQTSFETSLDIDQVQDMYLYYSDFINFKYSSEYAQTLKLK
ncbi:MAG: hypothetical protein RSB41_02720 [Bacilli bacterium]